jgi:DNA-binding CsgD family transcriptional regulator
MERLGQRDIRDLLECIGEVYAHAQLDTFGTHALTISRKLVGCDYGTHNGVNFRARRGWYVTEPAGIDLGFSKQDYARMMAVHPLINHYHRTSDGAARKLSDFWPQARYHESPLYRELFRRVNVEHMMAFYLPEGPPNSFAIALIRDRCDFTERDRLVLNLLRPHLFQAYRNAERVTRLREESAQTAAALEAVPHGVVTLDTLGRIRFCTARARQWLSDYFGHFASEGGRLPGQIACWLRQQQIPPLTNPSVPAPPEPLVLDRSVRRLTIRLLPGCTPGEQTLLLDEQCTELSAAPLQRLGLSAREAEVLLWVAQGKTNSEIGIILALSPGTVHKHTEHIFEKLGVETRTAAAAWAWRVLRQGPN